MWAAAFARYSPSVRPSQAKFLAVGSRTGAVAAGCGGAAQALRQGEGKVTSLWPCREAAELVPLVFTRSRTPCPLRVANPSVGELVGRVSDDGEHVPIGRASLNARQR